MVYEYTYFQLSKEKDKLLGEFSSTREILEQKEKLLEDKTQQLTMCQHHLQVRMEDHVITKFFSLSYIFGVWRHSSPQTLLSSVYILNTQALETKMKKESSEKCELMGRVGQVVEEKGHLEDRVKTLDRSLAAATAKSEELEQKLQTVCLYLFLCILFLVQI